MFCRSKFLCELTAIFCKLYNTPVKCGENVLPLEAKPLLTLKEASCYTGIGIKKLREMSNEKNCDYVIFVGRKRMLKREALLQFLRGAYSV